MAARPQRRYDGDINRQDGWGHRDYSQCQAVLGCPWFVNSLQTQNSQGQYVDLTLWSTGGESSSYLLTDSTTQGETWSPSASFTASADKLGFLTFGAEVNVNFSMDIKTTST
jgi:hypothetical protein